MTRPPEPSDWDGAIGDVRYPSLPYIGPPYPERIEVPVRLIEWDELRARLGRLPFSTVPGQAARAVEDVECSGGLPIVGIGNNDLVMQWGETFARFSDRATELIALENERQEQEARSAALLFSALSDDQQADWSLHGAFIAVGCETGTHFLIRAASALPNMCYRDWLGSLVNLCIISFTPCPGGDQVLMRKLAVEASESHFWTVAERSYPYSEEGMICWRHPCSLVERLPRASKTIDSLARPPLL